MSITVTALGTASGLPQPDRYGQTIVLSVTGSDAPQHYILDAGDGASSLLMRHGLDHNDIEAIFISHMHADHHCGLAQVVKTCMHVKRTRPLTILAPAEGIAPLQAYLEASYLRAPFLHYEIRWVSLAGYLEQAIALPGDVTLMPYANDHMRGYRQRLADDPHSASHTFESYSAVMTVGARRLVYSGNLAGARGSDELAPIIEPCDLFIAEMAHVDPGQLGRFLAGRRIHHTVVTHFHPKWNDVTDEDLAALIKQGTAGKLCGELTLLRDGETIAVS